MISLYRRRRREKKVPSLPPKQAIIYSSSTFDVQTLLYEDLSGNTKKTKTEN
jgi:hypothetical protein